MLVCAILECVCVLLFAYVCSTAVPCCSPAVFPPENDGALPAGTLLNHCDLITSTTHKAYTYIDSFTLSHCFRRNARATLIQGNKKLAFVWHFFLVLQKSDPVTN